MSDPSVKRFVVAARPHATPAEIAALGDTMRAIPGVEILAHTGKRAQIAATDEAADRLAHQLGAPFVIEPVQARSAKI